MFMNNQPDCWNYEILGVNANGKGEHQNMITISGQKFRLLKSKNWA